MRRRTPSRERANLWRRPPEGFGWRSTANGGTDKSTYTFVWRAPAVAWLVLAGVIVPAIGGAGAVTKVPRARGAQLQPRASQCIHGRFIVCPAVCRAYDYLLVADEPFDDLKSLVPAIRLGNDGKHRAQVAIEYAKFAAIVLRQEALNSQCLGEFGAFEFRQRVIVESLLQHTSFGADGPPPGLAVGAFVADGVALATQQELYFCAGLPYVQFAQHCFISLLAVELRAGEI